MGKSNYKYEFGEFRLDLLKRQLKRGQTQILLTPKIFDTLRILVQNQGQVVAKDLLMDEIWPDTFVEESSLMRNISLLRKALGEKDDVTPYIVTVPRHGYRFLAEVRQISEEGDSIVVHEHTRATITIEETDNDRSTLAVLPFKTAGDKHEDGYLGLGMADALITKLSNIKKIRVRPTSAVVKYNIPDQNPFEVGRELNVQTVVEGSIWQISERLRVTVQLVDVKDESALWAEKFDESFADIFAIQDSISDKVASALELQLTSHERQQLAKRDTESLTAYQLSMQAFYYMSQFTPQSIAMAIPYLEKAIEADPNYALAYSYLAGCNILFTTLNVCSASEVADKVRTYAKKAITLDNALPSAHYAKAFVHFFYDWDLKSAEKAFRQAIEANPADPMASKHYSIYLFSVGRFEEAITQAKITHHLDPITPGNTAHVGLTYYYARQYVEAIFWYRKALEMDTHFLNSQIGLALTFTQEGMFDEALSTISNIDGRIQYEPNFMATHSYICATAGKVKKARHILATLLEMSEIQFISSYDIAAVYAGLGDKEEAFVWLEKACNERSVWMRYLKVDPRFDPIRQGNRFESLLTKIGF